MYKKYRVPKKPKKAGPDELVLLFLLRRFDPVRLMRFYIYLALFSRVDNEHCVSTEDYGTLRLSGPNRMEIKLSRRLICYTNC